MCVGPGPASIIAAPIPPRFGESLIASGLQNPTAMEFAPDGRLFVAEQRGRLRVIKNGTLLTTPSVTVAVDYSGEAGLLGVNRPAFQENQYVYIYYTARTSPRRNRVSRFVANGDTAQPGSER